jgi:hypothetical protein
MGERDNWNEQTTPADAEATAFAAAEGPALNADAKPVPRDRFDTTEFSNSIRLTGRQWLYVGLFAVLLFFFASPLWKAVEPFSPGPDYRIPYDLGNDYWLYERHAAWAAEHSDTLVIGDSVVWGDYVTPQETLSHYLNELEGRERCANLGLEGAYPLALEGLVEHYAGSVTGKNVVLHCNPRWLWSPEADLQGDRPPDFHPKLLPQFSPRVPAYKAEISPRLGVAVEHRTPLAPWTNHLQQAYYRSNNIPEWTLDHPYDNPVAPLTRGLPPPETTLRHTPQPWYKSGITEEDFPWVDLPSSLQWPAFQRTVQLLRRRGNRVFVLVGPFNEHMLTPTSRQRYAQVKEEITAWLEAQQVPHLAPPPLPSERYGDASHPLADGYRELARQLLDEPAFRSFLSQQR